MSQNYSWPAGFSTSISPANGLTGAAVPSEADYMGANNGSGILVGVSADATGKLNVNVSSSVLPSGGATSANQTLQITQETAINANTLATATSVASIDTKTPTVGQKAMAASSPVVIASDQSTIPVSAASLPLPSGAATSANQTSQITQETAIAGSTASIDSKLGTLGQKAMAGSAPVVIASDQSAVPVSGTITVTGVATAANQTNASQKTQIVDGSANVIGSTSNALDVNIKSSGLSNQSVNLTQVAGASVATGHGTAAGAIRVELPTDGTGLVTVAQATAANLNATVVQGTATNLKTQANTYDGSGNAITSTASALDVNIKSGSPAGRAKANAPTLNDYSSTPVTSAAYVQLIASTTSAANLVEIFDSSGVALLFAVGAPASEIDQFYITPGGNGQVPLAIPAGSRISIKAASTSATVGFITVNLYT